MSLFAFLLDPFDPVRNVELFSRLEWLLPKIPLEHQGSLEAALSGFASWRDQYPHLEFPTDAQVIEVWPRLGPVSRLLVQMHDADHGIRRCAQDVAGEYELATLLLFDPDWVHDRVYGALALSTLPLGSLMSADGFSAPLRGLARGLIRVWSER